MTLVPFKCPGCGHVLPGAPSTATVTCIAVNRHPTRKPLLMVKETS